MTAVAGEDRKGAPAADVRRMRAVVVHGPGDLRVDERARPVPGAGEVLLAMEWGGICGSDIAYWRYGASGTAALAHPLVLGHEVAGRIVELGPGVTELGVTGLGVTGSGEGTPVTVHPAGLVGDGVLPERIAGRTNLYPRVRYFGSAAFTPHTDGGFSEYRTVRAEQIRPLPAGVSTEQGALAEPLAVALHAVGRVPDLRGRTVLVNGAGPIGSLVVAAARHRGAGTVIAADLSAPALAVARALGADETRDLARGDVLPQDVDVAFEASGAPAALGPVLRATARGGTLVQVGNLPGAAAPAVLGDLVTREITWIGSYRFVEEMDDALLALRDGLDLTPLITHRFPLARAEEALAVAADPAAGSSKVMLRLSGDVGSGQR
ncbi:L-idonate 5-dehydrogenase [Streptomyces sp. NPDC002793]|uniref:L-idonate 5-dehydrogenase n=1 Tax=Streptomyces sp. NPDC002793 TaxID=3154432 RepID=UPI00331FB1AE